MSFAYKSVRGGGSWRLNLLTAVLLLASVKGSSGCNVVLSGPNGTFTSENYPSNYPEKYTICTWDLAVDQGQRIRLVFTDFELEDPKDGQCEFDRVEITDPFSKQVLGSFCGNQLPPPLLGSGNTLRVTFTSDQSKSFRGFSANYFQTGPCERNSSLCEHLCRSQGADTYFCECREGYRLNVDNRTCTEIFLYGPTAGDNVLPVENSAVTYVTLETGIPIQDELQRDIFISSNGLISFGTEQRFPLLSANKSLLAVYACDIDNTDEVGGVFYHVYNATADAKLLGKASSEVRKFAGLEEFSASFVVVVTWDHVKQRLSWNQTSWSINEGEATFQAVLITDGFSSFALVYYFDGAMTWRRSWPEILIGVSDGQGRVEQSMYSGTEYAYLIDGVETNTGTRGTWIYKLGQVKNNPQQECYGWYLRNLPLKQQREEAFSALPQCPCSLKQDVWMELMDDWLISRNDSSVMCYRPGLCQSRPSYPTAKECCYYNDPSESATYRQLVLDPPNAGAALAFNPVFEELQEQHVLEDRKGHEACCVLSGRLNYCHLYYSLRPAGSCLGTFPTVPSLLWGDPHLVTLDDKTFTFNGLGEFILVTLDSPSVSFSLQCRTSLAETDPGLEPRSVNATVFTAFGARENNVSVFVGLDPRTRDSFVIYGNERDYSLQFRNYKTFREENEDFLLQRRGSNLTVRFSSGIRLRVSMQMKALIFSANIPTKFRNMTKGLLGNFNGDVEDEFTLPDGTVLSSNLTERQTFESFGSKWAVTRDNTVMRYDVGESADSYSFPDFRPIFLDEALTSVKIETIALWGESKPQCTYDYFATGSYAFASATCETERRADMEREQSNNSVPTIAGSGPAPVIVGQVVSVQMQVIDPDGQEVVFKLVDNQDTAVTLDPNTGNITFLLNSTQQKSVRVFAEDPLKAQSPVVTVPVLICSGCSGQGDCDYNNVLPAADERHFPIARCVCYPAFVGDDCQEERDACADQPCRPGQICRDLSAAEQGSNVVGYNCSECPEGFRYDSATMDCIDIDECVEEGLNKCQGSCRNTAGSYACACPPGYRLRADDGRTCHDVNECADRTDNCQQVCRNTVGAFECACEDGYYRVNDTSSGGCAQNSTSTATCSGYDCQQGCRPVTDATGVARAQCFCFSGYLLSPADNKTCLDVDECQAGICSQACQNAASGGFLCSCYAGFQLADDRITCVPCQAMRFGDNCRQVCMCSGQGKACDPARGCVCHEGWRGSQCEADVDECQETPEICGREAACVNTLGSYQCTCRDGYITDDYGNCKDVDECAEDSGLNTCRGTLQMCTNVPGSFYCTCFPGYRLGENGCTDVDECADNRGSCQQKCVNLFGSYNCECHYGYKLNPDRKTCYKVKDMCKEFWNLNCTHWCQQNNTGEAICSCNIGYELGEDRQTCTDVNECERNLANCSDSCTNTEGGFICSCPRGKMLDADGKTCVACPRGTFGSNCSQLCDCGPGANFCDVNTGCACAPGWMGKKCDIDINECENDTGLLECRNRHAACRNSQGSYRCQCSAGYTENEAGICTDVDECTSNPCDQTCENSLGSYRCLCKKGFSFDTGKNRCTDIDECASSVTNLCSQYCENTIGSYLCACTAAGYELADDRVSCRETAACERKDCDKLHGGCERRNETETCFCNQGYTWDVNNTACVLKEVDWCRESKCQQLCDESKEETPFSCGCADGFLLNEDGRSCRECPQGAYGPQCAFVCPPCETQTTALCNVTTGNCTCAQGWRGDRCEVDVNECEEASGLSACPEHSVCANTPGSFTCLCQAGYYKSPQNTCSACWAWSFGRNCEDSCSCNVRNSELCNHVNGTCTCTAGWRGATCEEDVNECQLGFCSGEGELCENKEGTYVCSCKEGFASRSDGKCVEFLSIEFQLIVETDVAADLSDSSSVAYQLLKENLREAIFKALNQSVKGVIAVHVIALRRGSLIVDVEAVVAKEAKSQTASDLSLALLDIVRRGLTVGGQTVRCSVTIDGIRVDSNSTVCLAYLAMNVCDDGQTCEEEDGAPVCRPATINGKTNALSLALGIGLPLFLLATAALTVLACRVRHRKISKRWDRESYQKDRHSLPPEHIRMSFSQY